MFIAVHRYRQKYGGSDENHKVAVLDTEDCSVEVVSQPELRESGILRSIENFDDLSEFAYITNINNILPVHKPSFVRYCKHILYVGERQVKVIAGGSYIEVNDFKYVSHEDTSFLYPVLYGSYVILRFLILGDTRYGFISVSVDENGAIEYWTDDYKEASNKGLGIKLDILLGEV